MSEDLPSIELRLTIVEERLRVVEEGLAAVVEGLNEPPKRTLRHPFASIRELQLQVGEVNEEFQRLLSNLRQPPAP